MNNMRKEVESSAKRTKAMILVILLGIVQAVSRLLFAIVGIPSGMGQFLDVPISYTSNLIILVTFLFLGASGLGVTYGLWRKQRWGFWGTALVSVATIVFDVWGFTIQSSAILGFVIPALSLLYLYAERQQLLI